MVGICLGLINIGSCGKATAINKTIINKQMSEITNIVANQSHTTIIQSSDSVSDLIDVSIESEGTVIIKDLDLSQYAAIKADTDIKVIEKIKSDTIIDQIVKSLVDVAIKQNAATGIFGSGKTITDNKLIENIKTEVKNNIKISFNKTDKFGCVHTAMNKANVTIHAKGDVIITGFKISQKVEDVSKCIINVFMDTINNIKISTKLEDDINDHISQKSDSSGNIIIIITIIIFVLLIMALIGGSILLFRGNYIKKLNK